MKIYSLYLLTIVLLFTSCFKRKQKEYTCYCYFIPTPLSDGYRKGTKTEKIKIKYRQKDEAKNECGKLSWKYHNEHYDGVCGLSD